MPSLKNLLVFPEAHVAPCTSDGQSEVYVRGLACNSICARRVKQALSALEGVSSVSFDPQRDVFAIEHAAEGVSADAFQDAVRGQVVFPWARRVLAGLAVRS